MMHDDAIVLMESCIKDCPQLDLEIDKEHIRTNDARFSMLVKVGKDEVRVGHLDPNTTWHTLYMMQRGIASALEIGEHRGRQNARDLFNKNIAEILLIKS